MSGNGRGTMRPQGRAPPFLIIGLLVVVCILGFSYWNASSTSGEKELVISRLQDELQSLSSRKLEAEKRSSEINTKLFEASEAKKTLEASLSSSKKDAEHAINELRSKTNELESLKNDVQAKKDGLTKCEQDTAGINQELQKLKEETETLKQNAKNNPSPCDQTACEGPIKTIMTILVKGFNRTQMVAQLQQNGIDSSKLFPEDTNQPGPSVGQQSPANAQPVNPVNPNQPVGQGQPAAGQIAPPQDPPKPVGADAAAQRKSAEALKFEPHDIEDIKKDDAIDAMNENMAIEDEKQPLFL